MLCLRTAGAYAGRSVETEAAALPECIWNI